MATRILVIGIGNPLRADDGVGVYAVRDLERQAWPDGVAFHEAGIATHDLAFRCEGYDALVVLDAVLAGKEPGQWFEVGSAGLLGAEPAPGAGLTAHLGFMQTLTLAFLDAPMPQLVLLGMEPGDAASWREGLTPAVAAGYPAYLSAARARILELSGSGAGPHDETVREAGDGAA